MTLVTESSGTSTTGSTGRREKIPEGTLCVVCSDTASGIHYSVASCNGCKTFFRRAIVNRQQFKCQHDNNCIVDKSVRCGCRSCRLNKCFQMGMDPNAIQHDRDKIRYTKRITKLKAANDEILNGNKTSPIDSRLSNEDSPYSPNGVSSVETSDPNSAITNIINELLALEQKIDYLRLSAMEPHSSAFFSMSEPRLLEDDAWLSKHSAPIHICSTLRPCMPENKHYWILRDLTLMIEWVKCQPVVQNLLLSDKMAIVKTFAPIYPLLQLAFYSRNDVPDCLVYPDGTCLERESDDGSFDKNSQPINSMLLDGIHQRIRQLNLDLRDFLLYKLMLLFNPDADGLSQNGKNVITNERQALLAYLYQHIRSVHGERSTELFGTLLMMTATLNRIASFQKRDFEVQRIFESTTRDDLIKQLIMGGM